MPNNPQSSYSYNCEDKSIILPVFREHYVKQFFKLVPTMLTANIITICSSGLIFSMLVGSFFYAEIGWMPLLFAFCIHGYVVGDHLDGMQAKATKTGSPLGEFLDHYLDVFNGAIILLVTIRLLGSIDNIWFYFILWVNFMAFALTMVEELQTGKLVFGKIGTLEGIILLLLFLVSWYVPAIRTFWSETKILNIQLYWVVIIAMTLGYILTVLDICLRLKKVPLHFIIFSLGSGFLAVALCLLNTNQTFGWLIMTAYCGEYIGKVMRNYLLQKQESIVGLISILVPGVLFVIALSDLLSQSNLQYLLIALCGYWSIKVIMVFFAVFSGLKLHWLWINPVKN